jgi:hypothetical protein
LRSRSGGARTPGLVAVVSGLESSGTMRTSAGGLSRQDESRVRRGGPASGRRPEELLAAP